MTVLWRKYSFVILFVVTALFFSFFLVFTNTAESDSTYAEITVQKGDTLWAYAEDYAAHTSMTQEKFIEWVTERNGLTSHLIVAGDQLELPVPEETFKFSEDAIHLASDRK